MGAKLIEFFAKYESKIVLVLGFVLVSAISFEAGAIKSAKISQKPIVIEKLASVDCEKQNSNPQESQNLIQEGQNDISGMNKPGQTVPTNRQDCAYVGSKNSNKYHLSTCRWAKNIKPENVICFKDKNDAESKGYLPDKNCIK
ncbi:MAG TPA: hypothetical protein P5262_04440 [Candidatus Moranbacteria bacterium]|nr:hypothetical protein [Candidatus Moranbacteria bacterium]